LYFILYRYQYSRTYTGSNLLSVTENLPVMTKIFRSVFIMKIGGGDTSDQSGLDFCS